MGGGSRGEDASRARGRARGRAPGRVRSRGPLRVTSPRMGWRGESAVAAPRGVGAGARRGRARTTRAARPPRRAAAGARRRERAPRGVAAAPGATPDTARALATMSLAGWRGRRGPGRRSRRAERRASRRRAGRGEGPRGERSGGGRTSEGRASFAAREARARSGTGARRSLPSPSVVDPQAQAPGHVREGREEFQKYATVCAVWKRGGARTHDVTVSRKTRQFPRG